MLAIATRGSLLALWQARHVEQALHMLNPGLATRLEIIRTTGDRVTDVPLSSIGDRGLFTRELDNALLSGAADCAVHSLKDVPTMLPEGLAIAAVLEREDPRDAWLARDGNATLTSIPAGVRVGTSSLRRRALLVAARPDVTVLDVRGNLDTRLQKLQDGQYDALILALAGLRRLEREDAVTEVLATPDWLPAPGQGAMAVVIRTDDDRTRALIGGLDHAPTAAAVRAERALLRTLEGGCQIPIGALAEHGASAERGASAEDGTSVQHAAHDEITLHGLVADPDGGSVIRAHATGTMQDPQALGERVAEALIERGADAILTRLRNATPRTTPEVSPP